MKRSPFSVVLALAVVSCGTFSSSSDETPAPAVEPGADPGKEAPPPEPVTGVPGENELTEQFGVFVVEGGAQGAPGTRAEPLGSVQAAIDKAKANFRRVYVCAGTFNEALTMVSGVSVIGGYGCASSKWSPSDKRTRVVAPTSPALQARNIDRPTRIDGLDVVAPAGTADARSSIAFIAEKASSLAVARSEFRAGPGANGAPGTTPAAATHTASPNGAGHIPEVDPCSLPGVAVASCIANGPAPRPGPAGGVATCSAGPQPEAGGAGGGGAVFKNVANTWTLQLTGAARGVRTGAAGADGARGASAAAGTISAGGFTPGDGTKGGDGGAGFGGSGGAALVEIRWPLRDSEWRWASTGGSGGAGGCAGLAGTPGTGGGASIALISVDSSAMKLEAVALIAAAGGDGAPGTFGSEPSDGGAFGASLTTPAAEPGGRGGRAGISGSGAGGPSIALAHTGGAPAQLQVKLERAAGGRGVSEMSAGAETIPASTAGEGADIHPF